MKMRCGPSKINVCVLNQWGKYLIIKKLYVCILHTYSRLFQQREKMKQEKRRRRQRRKDCQRSPKEEEEKSLKKGKASHYGKLLDLVFDEIKLEISMFWFIFPSIGSYNHLLILVWLCMCLTSKMCWPNQS